MEYNQDSNGSTALTWLWALWFGPIYFIVHGFYRDAVWITVALVAGSLVVSAYGFVFVVTLCYGVLSAVLAYRAWIRRAGDEQKLQDRDPRGDKVSGDCPGEGLPKAQSHESVRTFVYE